MGRIQPSHQHCSNLDCDRPWRRSFADSIACTDWHRDNFFVFVVVRSLCPDRGRSRIELDPPTCTARSRLEAVLPNAALALREVKCPPGRVSLRR